MGLRVRLKASVDISGLPYQARVVAQALKRYGMILADNGSPWFISGAPTATGTTTRCTCSTGSAAATSRSSTRSSLPHPGPVTAAPEGVPTSRRHRLLVVRCAARHRLTAGETCELLGSSPSTGSCCPRHAGALLGICRGGRDGAAARAERRRATDRRAACSPASPRLPHHPARPGRGRQRAADAARSTSASYRHDVGAAWLWLAARNGAFGPAARGASASARCARATPARAGRAEPFGVRLGGVGRDGRRAPSLPRPAAGRPRRATARDRARAHLEGAAAPARGSWRATPPTPGSTRSCTWSRARGRASRSAGRRRQLGISRARPRPAVRRPTRRGSRSERAGRSGRAASRAPPTPASAPVGSPRSSGRRAVSPAAAAAPTAVLAAARVRGAAGLAPPAWACRRWSRSPARRLSAARSAPARARRHARPGDAARRRRRARRRRATARRSCSPTASCRPTALILGASGAGKSTTLLTILTDQIRRGRPVVAIDMKGSPAFAARACARRPRAAGRPFGCGRSTARATGTRSPTATPPSSRTS